MRGKVILLEKKMLAIYILDRANSQIRDLTGRVNRLEQKTRDCVALSRIMVAYGGIWEENVQTK